MTLTATITRILAPTDFSPAAEAACRLAARLAMRAEAKLIVFHALPGTDLGQQVQSGRTQVEILNDSRERLGEWFAAVVPVELRRFLATEFKVIAGEPTPGIARAAKLSGADLILMATQGRTGLAHLLMGSVTESVLRTVPVPVLALRLGQEERPLTTVQRILWATDLSPVSEAAWPFALRLADLMTAEVVLLHAVRPADLAGLADHPVPPPKGWMERYLTPLEDELERRRQAVEGLGLRARRKIVVGVPAEVIVTEAQTEQADLIVMGTHGRSGFRHILLGSVAEAVIRKAACPVLAVQVKPEGEAPDVDTDAPSAQAGTPGESET
ncbi:MAG: universal stress protein [Candidatus Methylomirabilales bacterium]